MVNMTKSPRTKPWESRELVAYYVLRPRAREARGRLNAQRCEF